MHNPDSFCGKPSRPIDCRTLPYRARGALSPPGSATNHVAEGPPPCGPTAGGPQSQSTTRTTPGASTLSFKDIHGAGAASAQFKRSRILDEGASSIEKGSGPPATGSGRLSGRERTGSTVTIYGGARAGGGYSEYILRAGTREDGSAVCGLCSWRAAPKLGVRGRRRTRYTVGVAYSRLSLGFRGLGGRKAAAAANSESNC